MTPAAQGGIIHGVHGINIDPVQFLFHWRVER